VKRVNSRQGKIRRPGVVPGPGKVIIAGVGRSGTTFLTHLLTALGIPTGFSLSECLSTEKSPCRAGLERAGSPLSSYVSKDPEYSLLIQELLEKGVELDHVYIPFRDIRQAALSRTAIGPDKAGGVWRVEARGESKEKVDLLQEQKLQEILQQALCDLEKNGVPHTFLLYPRFASDCAYCYQGLSFLLEKFGISWKIFSRIFSRVSKPEMIHVY